MRPERIAFARRLVKSTDRVFTLATAEGMVADIVRTRVVPTVFPTLAKLELFREFLFGRCLRLLSTIVIVRSATDAPGAFMAVIACHG